jgi:uncharacterized membrane protein YfcA
MIGRMVSTKNVRTCLLLLTGLQVATTQAYRLSGSAQPEEARARAVEGPVTPDGAAFAIWGPLFVASALYAAGSGGKQARRADVLAGIAFGANSLWNILTQLRGLGWFSVAVITLAASGATGSMLAHVRRQDRISWRQAKLIGGLAGWLSVALFANIEASLNSTTDKPPTDIEERRAAALVSVASAAAVSANYFSRGNPAYALAAGWGLGGVAVKAAKQKHRNVLLVASGGLLVLTLASMISRRRTE